MHSITSTEIKHRKLSILINRIHLFYLIVSFPSFSSSFKFWFSLVLQLNLPDRDEFKSIGINTKQRLDHFIEIFSKRIVCLFRIAVLPVLNSMLINQQRSDGRLNRVLSAQTTIRYRLIEKNNYQVLPVTFFAWKKIIQIFFFQ